MNKHKMKIRVFFGLLVLNTLLICMNGFCVTKNEDRSLMYLKTYKDYLRRKNDTSEVETIIFNVYSSSELDSYYKENGSTTFNNLKDLENFPPLTQDLNSELRIVTQVNYQFPMLYIDYHLNIIN